MIKIVPPFKITDSKVALPSNKSFIMHKFSIRAFIANSTMAATKPTLPDTVTQLFHLFHFGTLVKCQLLTSLGYMTTLRTQLILLILSSKFKLLSSIKCLLIWITTLSLRELIWPTPVMLLLSWPSITKATTLTRSQLKAQMPQQPQ
jgi:hypothetical protein